MDEQRLTVRRARARDAERLAVFISRALGGRTSVQPRRVIARLGDVGVLLAEDDGRLLGLTGWRVENLVACVTDLIILPASRRLQIGRALFEAMEDAASDLQAEVAMLFLPPARPPELSAFLDQIGYQSRRVDELPRAWQEVASQVGLGDDDVLPIKHLRSESVFRPL